MKPFLLGYEANKQDFLGFREGWGGRVGVKELPSN